MQDFLKQLPAVLYEFTINKDGQSCFTYISDSVEKILKLTTTIVLQDKGCIESLIHPEDKQYFYESSLQSELQETDWFWQGRLQIKGEDRWFSMQSSFSKDNTGNIVKRGLIQDVTGNRENTKETEIKYHSLVERLPIGIVIHNHGKVVFANQQAHLILGAQPGALVGKHVLNYVHPDYKDKILHRLKEAAAVNPAPMVEEQYIRVDGKVIDVETSAFPYVYKGAPSIQVIFRDITERKYAESEIRKNETLFSQLFENVPMAVVLLDEYGKVKQLNHGFKQMFGFDLSELKGRNLNDFIVPDALCNEGIDLNNLITSNKVVRLDTLRKHRDGRIVNVLLYGVPVLYEGEIIGIYGVYVDITDRMKVEEELKIRNNELDNFVYKVSHDLRAPLSSILGLVNLARLPGNTDDPMDYIEIIGDKVQHLDNFIGDVLSHSKNLKMEVSICSVSLKQIIERTFNDLNYLEGANEVTKSIKIEGVEFHSDPWRIAEIFRNLISNAIKYRRLSDITPVIEIQIKVDNVRAEIIFADNGIGIEESNLAKIFEMFYRATEQSDGSGIGLYIVKNAVDKLNGQISVASKPGYGTRFLIILPNRIKNPIGKILPLAIEQ
jgi:PAS domain S-box-containing protein